MKANIHPEYKETKVTCTCGNIFTVKSTENELYVEVCDKCHPFYTGQAGNTRRAGKVDKFNKKYGFDKKENK